jgi:hypothetical protein
VWYGFAKATQAAGHKVLWLADEPRTDMADIDSETTVVIAEQYQAKHLPKIKKATYVVHTLKRGPEWDFAYRVIDLAYNCHYQDHPVNYNFSIDRFALQNVGPLSYYDSVLDRVYMSWATNLLPDEIDLEMAKHPREKTYYHVGTLYDGKYSNEDPIRVWKQKCADIGVAFVHIDPWTNPVSMEDNRLLIEQSHSAPDLRGQQNIDSGYIACRLFKNISYGQLGITNSLTQHYAMGETTIYDPRVGQLFDKSLPLLGDIRRIQAQMDYVRRNHTYVNRLNSLLEIL